LAEVASLGPPSNQAIDLLKNVDVKRDAVSGKWTLQGNELVANGWTGDSAPAGSPDFWTLRLAIPIETGPEYDLHIEFTRISGAQDVSLFLPVGDAQCRVVLSGWRGDLDGIDMVDGRLANAEEPPLIQRPSIVKNQQRTAVDASVKVQGESADIRISIQGQKPIHFRGKTSALGVDPTWQFPDRKCIGLGGLDANIAFHSVSLRRPKSATIFHAARLRLVTEGASEKEPLSPPAPAKIGPDSKAPPTAAGMPSGAVLVYTFDKSSFAQLDGKLYVKDLSGHGNHGIVHGAEQVEGRAGGALSFKGKEDYVECKNSSSLNPTAALTVCAWIKVRSLRAGYLVSKEDWKDGEHGYVLRADDIQTGKFKLTIGDGTWHDARSDDPVDLAEWHHVASTFDGKSMVVFVDGRKGPPTTLEQPISPSPGNLRIGCGSFDTERDFDGVIDEVAIFARALSDKEVQAVYAMGVKGQSLAGSERSVPSAPASRSGK
jgi:hypothetical protein